MKKLEHAHSNGLKQLDVCEQPLYAIAVPGDAYNFKKVIHFKENSIHFTIDKISLSGTPYSMGGFFKHNGLQNIDFEIVGTATKDHIDFDPTEFLDCIGDFDDIPVYTMYGEKEGYCSYGDEAFRSLLTANGIDFNDGQKLVFIKPV